MTDKQKQCLDWIDQNGGTKIRVSAAIRAGFSGSTFYSMMKMYKAGTKLAKQEAKRIERPRTDMQEIVAVLTDKFGPPTMTFYSHETGTEIIIRANRR